MNADGYKVMYADGYKGLVMSLNKVIKSLETELDLYEIMDEMNDVTNSKTLSTTVRHLKNALDEMNGARDILMQAEAEERKVENRGH